MREGGRHDKVLNYTADDRQAMRMTQVMMVIVMIVMTRIVVKSTAKLSKKL